MDKVLGLFKQKSTWRGLAIIAGAFGVYIDPALIEAALLLSGAAIGAVEVAPDQAFES